VALHSLPPGAGGWSQTAMQQVGANTWEAALGFFDSAGLLQYYIEALDVQGKVSNSATQWLQVEPCVSEITGFEVTQATQTESGKLPDGTLIPLVAGKDALVRVFVDCGLGCTELSAVTGTLTLSTDGIVRDADNRDGKVTAKHGEAWGDQRADLTNSLNFIVEVTVLLVRLVFRLASEVLREQSTFPSRRSSWPQIRSTS
jgi:hypothetical protein